MKTFERIAGWANLLEAAIMWGMQTYLTSVWNLSMSHAAGIINVWNGLTFFLPIPFAFFADSFLGNFYMLMFSCFVDTIGLGFLTLSTPDFLRPCKDNDQCIGPKQKTLFYFALTLIAAALASRTVSQDQYFKELEGETTNDGKKEEGICECSLGQKLTFCVMAVIVIISSLVLPFIGSWAVKFGIPAICSVLALLIFLNSQFCHRYPREGPQGSPLTTYFRVFVAAISKKSEKLPEDCNNENNLYQSDDHAEVTRSLRCLNKAAIILPTPSEEEQKNDKWHLCSVREVEDTKACIKMTPLCITLVVCGLVLSLGNTYFQQQADQLNQKLRRLKVNVLIFFLFFSSASFVSSSIYSFYKRWSAEKKKKYFPLYGIAFALVTSILCCIIAAKVESRRLELTRNNDSMSMFTLIPQYLFLGVFSGISSTCYEELFKTRYPSSMNKYIKYFTLGLTGIGTAASYLQVYVVGKVSERGGSPNWFQHSLNESRLDKYYWTLAVISSLNLLLYIVVARIVPQPKPKQLTGIQKVKMFVYHCYQRLCKCMCKCVCKSVCDCVSCCCKSVCDCVSCCCCCCCCR